MINILSFTCRCFVCSRTVSDSSSLVMVLFHLCRQSQDEESVPMELRNLPEYKELLQLKRLKKQKLQEIREDNGAVQHLGYKVKPLYTHRYSLLRTAPCVCSWCLAKIFKPFKFQTQTSAMFFAGFYIINQEKLHMLMMKGNNTLFLSNQK